MQAHLSWQRSDDKDQSGLKPLSSRTLVPISYTSTSKLLLHQVNIHNLQRPASQQQRHRRDPEKSSSSPITRLDTRRSRKKWPAAYIPSRSPLIFWTARHTRRQKTSSAIAIPNYLSYLQEENLKCHHLKARPNGFVQLTDPEQYAFVAHNKVSDLRQTLNTKQKGEIITL